MSALATLSPEEVAVMEEVHITHIPCDRVFQSNLRRLDLDSTACRTLCATIAARSDVRRARVSAEGWLVVEYKAGSLTGPKLENFQDRLGKTLQRLIARKVISMRQAATA